MMQPLVLASASPRRREILAAMGVECEVVASSVDERLIAADHPRTFALRAAFAKLKDVAARVDPGRLVLAADTVVTRNLVLYGKPGSPAEAHEMLAALAGDVHEVITGVAVGSAGSPTVYLNAATTRVHFRPLDAETIARYVDSGEPMDKAGAYGIQGAAGEFVSHIEGDYFNVVGLPCQLTAELLTEAGHEGRIILPAPPLRFSTGL
jgi:septum formation protein